MKKNILLVSIVLIITTSCNQIASNTVKSILENNQSESLSDSHFRQVSIDHQYSLSLPNYMKVFSGLNEESTIQYANIYKELYTIVIAESAKEFKNSFIEYGEYDKNIPLIENYKNVQYRMMKEGMVYSSNKEYGLTEINGFPARQYSITATVDNINAVYLITLIEGNESVYMIMTWTLKERLKRFSNTMEIINSSFELTSKKN